MTDLQSFASEANTSEAKQVVIVRMREMSDGEYECKSWQETETQYGKTYLVSIIKKGINQLFKIYANSYLKKKIDDMVGNDPFKITMKNGYIDTKINTVQELPNGNYASTEWKKFTVRSENRETYIITLSNGKKIWANSYLNKVLEDCTIIQITFSITFGKINDFKTIKIKK